MVSILTLGANPGIGTCPTGEGLFADPEMKENAALYQAASLTLAIVKILLADIISRMGEGTLSSCDATISIFAGSSPEPGALLGQGGQVSSH